MKTFHIVSLPGDGIGTEVTAIALKVLNAVCDSFDVSLEVTERLIGGAAYDAEGAPISDETIEICKNSDAVLLGAVGGPKWESVDIPLRPEAALLRLRKELGVYANLRPVTIHDSLISASSLRPEVLKGVDILIVRELTGGIYFGRPRFTDEESGDRRAVDTMEYRASEIERVAVKAFEAARLRSSRVCSVDKANILDCSRLWRETVQSVSNRYSDVALEHMLVDNCAMQLIRNPGQFDVMLTGNLFGDILSDEAAMLTGSIGMLPSASIGDGIGLYEPVHGSAPDIAGQDKANPLAAIASTAMLCRYSLGLEEAARSIEKGVSDFLATGYRTGDIYTGSKEEKLTGTTETGDQLLSLLDLNTKSNTTA
ncbi:MAG: 3-isopropylmalate dehydrogenase [Balneolaceae bacterium]